MDVRTVTVLGANGTMGLSVAGLFASFGDAKVFMVCRDPEHAEGLADRAAASVRAGSVSGNFEVVGYDVLEHCVSQSDLVFESVAEDLATKVDVWSRVGECLRPGTIAGTGTSGLSIERLAGVLPASRRPYFTGMHFFNPPYAMRLCELCPAQAMGDALAQDIERYLSERLLRVVVRVSDAPAFLGNRIGFEFINRAMQLADRHIDGCDTVSAGISFVDSILGPFSGRAMAPLNTADFVGLDVCEAIVDNVFANATDDPLRDAFSLPAFCRNLILSGRLGRKTHDLGGLFKLEVDADGTRRPLVFDVDTYEYCEREPQAMPFADHVVEALRCGDYRRAVAEIFSDDDQARLCARMLCEYLVYALWAAERVSGDVRSADDVMAAGFNWCPPLALVEAMELLGNVAELVRYHTDARVTEALDIERILDRLPASRYDFRRYFRAQR